MHLWHAELGSSEASSHHFVFNLSRADLFQLLDTFPSQLKTSVYITKFKEKTTNTIKCLTRLELMLFSLIIL